MFIVVVVFFLAYLFGRWTANVNFHLISYRLNSVSQQPSNWASNNFNVTKKNKPTFLSSTNLKRK